MYPWIIIERSRGGFSVTLCITRYLVFRWGFDNLLKSSSLLRCNCLFCHKIIQKYRKMRLITFPILHNLELKLCRFMIRLCACWGTRLLFFFFFICLHITGFVLCVFARQLFSFWWAVLCRENSWMVGRFTFGHLMWILRGFCHWIELPLSWWLHTFLDIGMTQDSCWKIFNAHSPPTALPFWFVSFLSTRLAEVSHLFPHWLNWFVPHKA